MKLKISTAQKIVITVLVMGCSVAGFMVKLPAMFRHYDREMHAAFYFMAAAFFTLLFAGKNFWIHLFIVAALAVFGVGIEYAQAYSNRLVRHPFHGRFDPEDVKYNIMGLLAFSAIWIMYLLGAWLLPAQHPAKNSVEEKL
jgi:hypothetical protein